jgi:hypothetical protein
MPKFVIERDMPGAGKLSPEQLKATSKKSAAVMREIGTVHWVQTYVTDDKIYCVYVAPDEDTIRKHAQASGLPADRVSPVRTVVDATTAE